MKPPRLFGSLLLLAGTASHAGAVDGALFVETIAPLLEAQCIVCHGPEKQESGLRLDSLAAAVAGGDSGPAIVPGDVDQSLLIRAVGYRDPDLQMPPEGRLTDEQIEVLHQWILDGAVWPEPALVLFEDELALVETLAEGDGPIDLDRSDRAAGEAALLVGRQRFSSQLDGWDFPIAENPRAGEYRYLRFVWKTRGDAGGIMFELANDGQWRTELQTNAAWTAGQNTTGWAAHSVADESPTEWTVVTRDLWEDRGDWDSLRITGCCLTAIGGGEAMIDSIVLGPTLASLDAYRPGGRPYARFALPQPDRSLGDAWSDPDNPVVKAFRGERLDLWSLKPMVRPDVPDIQADDGVRSPIDRFVLARLQPAGLTLSSAADRRTLIRRLSYDLTGLPPTPEEVRAFSNDPSPDAWNNLVERLLASEHFGQRWAQHWLDTVRYSDTNGFERDEFRPTMYRFRDYVVRSLNEDKPYDQFLREQLAGDELVAGRPLDDHAVQSLIATGFLRAGPRDTTAEIFDETDRARDQWMADLANTTGEALLGLTMSCCQCHDHKYDPLLQADHFRLRAFFAAVAYEDALVINTDAQRSEIDSYNRRLDDHTTPLTERQVALVSIGRDRVRSVRLDQIPEEIRQLLDQDESTLDEEARARLAPYHEQLNVGDEDALNGLTKKERDEYDELTGRIDRLHQRRREYATCWGVVESGANAPKTRILFQGDISQPGERVAAGFLSILDPNPAPIDRPMSNQSTGRRTALANWIVSHHCPLTARVLVNRIWQQYFGHGIVATPNDFGYSGARPTHPELLDWLASEFIDSGWSMKHLHRLIVNSATYRQASSYHPAGAALDRENRLLWRQNPRRLDAEGLRDAMLLVSGELLPVDSGPPAWPDIPEQVRRSNPATLDASDDRLQDWYTTEDQGLTLVRSLFIVQKRSIQLPILMAFDEPSGERTCGRREQTTVAPQAVMLMNSPFAMHCAAAMARRVRSEAGDDLGRQVQRAFELALLREPTVEERAAALDLIARHERTYRESGSPSPQRDAVTDLCRALLNVNEFVYLD